MMWPNAMTSIEDCFRSLGGSRCEARREIVTRKARLGRAVAPPPGHSSRSDLR